MMRRAAGLWLAFVILAGLYVGMHVQRGLPLRSDLLALLPNEAKDPVLAKANDAVTRALARRVVVMIGHPARDKARSSAQQMSAALQATGLLDTSSGTISPDRMRKFGALYFPHRRALLTADDRADLEAGRGDVIANRALAQAFGVGGMATSDLLRSDPFMLLPSFLASLPVPLSRLAPDDGVLSVADNGTTWVAIIGQLLDEPFSLDVQARLVGAFDKTSSKLRAADPSLQVLRTGAVFFAAAGASSAISEASTLTIAGLLGTVLLIAVVFRSLGPLWTNVLAVLIGTLVGIAADLLLFGELHVAALLFGTSLIGVAVDYGLQYSTSIFGGAATPQQRLVRIGPGITLGLITSLVGYGMLALAPFPGLRQIAVFSVIGLLGAFATVILWFPLADRALPPRHGQTMLRQAAAYFALWHRPDWRTARTALLVCTAVVAGIGLMRLTFDDDVRKLQPRSVELIRHQEAIAAIMGALPSTQYVLVSGPDDDTAVARQEALVPVIAKLRQTGALAGAQMPAAYVPSAARQQRDLQLVTERLDAPLIERHRATLGLSATGALEASPSKPLTIDSARASGALPFLNELVLAPGLHAVVLQGLTRPGDVRAAISGLPGVQLVDRTAELSALLGKYRQRALWLTAASAVLILLGLALRYGMAGAFRTMLPPLAAVILSPLAIAAFGQPLTFFHAMGLVLILGIGVDYAIFFAESESDQRPVTMLGVWLAALTSLLSFGLLALSQVPAMTQIGLTMIIGILVSLLLSPLAVDASAIDDRTQSP
jgi:predicted exporter